MATIILSFKDKFIYFLSDVMFSSHRDDVAFRMAQMLSNKYEK